MEHKYYNQGVRNLINLIVELEEKGPARDDRDYTNIIRHALCSIYAGQCKSGFPLNETERKDALEAMIREGPNLLVERIEISEEYEKFGFIRGIYVLLEEGKGYVASGIEFPKKGLELLEHEKLSVYLKKDPRYEQVCKSLEVKNGRI